MLNFNLNDPSYIGNVTETGIVRDGLVMHLDAANRNSYPGIGTFVKDLSGNGYHGTFNGPITWVNVGYGAFSFNGGSTWIDTQLNIDANPNSVCAWFYCTDVTTANGRGVVLTDNGGWDKGFGTVSSLWEIHVGDNQATSGTNAPVNNKWYFGCLTYSNTNVILYINGANAVYTKGSGPGGTSGEPVEIGRAYYSGGGGSRWWAGYISNVQIYNRVLSSSEINQNYNAIKWRYNL
jgi:hypothetical protein